MLTANNSRKMHMQVFTTGKCWLAQKKKQQNKSIRSVGENSNTQCLRRILQKELKDTIAE